MLKRMLTASFAIALYATGCYQPRISISEQTLSQIPEQVIPHKVRIFESYEAFPPDSVFSVLMHKISAEGIPEYKVGITPDGTILQYRTDTASGIDTMQVPQESVTAIVYRAKALGFFEWNSRYRANAEGFRTAFSLDRPRLRGITTIHHEGISKTISDFGNSPPELDSLNSYIDSVVNSAQK